VILRFAHFKYIQNKEKKMKKVLIAVDNPNGAKAVLSLYRELVSTPEEVILLHVEQLEGNVRMTAMLGEAEMSTLREALKDTEYKEALDRNAENVLSFCKTELMHGGLVSMRAIVREGDPSEEILRVADDEDVDLIIVGCSGKSRLRRYLTGCASREVEKNAKIPVLIAKGDGCGIHADVWNGRETYAL
jgi:nucleotide-binding universal stress UspA family protein